MWVRALTGLLVTSVAQGAASSSYGPTYGTLGVYSEAYRANATQPENKYPTLLLEGRYESHGSWLGGAAEAEGYLNTKESAARYLNVRELYVKIERGSRGFAAAFGRKREEWSTLDEDWELGLWQPRFRWNYLDPDMVGLTGFFGSFESERVRAQVFATPFYVPELGGQLELNDGAASSPNRFVAVPPRQISLMGAQTPVNYRLDDTRLSRIVLNPGGGAALRVGGRQGVWARAAYAYQPINRIVLAYEGYLMLTSASVDVTLHPRVIYQHLAGLDVGYDAEGWRASVSALVQRPVREARPAAWTAEQVSPAFLFSPRASFELDRFGLRDSVLSLSYLFSSGGTAADEGPLASPGGAIFESRYSFRSAVSARLSARVSGDAEKGLLVSSRSIYDFTVQGALLSLDLSYSYSRHWNIGIGGDVVGAARAEAAGGGADLFHLNRSNDRIRGKIAYVF